MQETISKYLTQNKGYLPLQHLPCQKTACYPLHYPIFQEIGNIDMKDRSYGPKDKGS